MKGNVKNQKARVKSNQVPEETSHQSPSQSNSHRTRKRVANMPVSRAMENQGTSDLLWDRPHPKHSSFRGSVFEPQSEQMLSMIFYLAAFVSLIGLLTGFDLAKKPILKSSKQACEYNPGHSTA